MNDKRRIEDMVDSTSTVRPEVRNKIIISKNGKSATHIFGEFPIICEFADGSRYCPQIIDHECLDVCKQFNQKKPKHRFFNAAVSVLWSWFCLALGGISLLAMLPFMVMARLARKDKPWI